VTATITSHDGTIIEFEPESVDIKAMTWRTWFGPPWSEDTLARVVFDGYKIDLAWPSNVPMPTYISEFDLMEDDVYVHRYSPCVVMATEPGSIQIHAAGRKVETLTPPDSSP